MNENQPDIDHQIAKMFPALELILPSEALSEIAAAKRKDLPLFHFGFGLFLRNNMLHPDSKLYNSFIREGIVHKDDMSEMIMRLFHEYLKTK